VLQEVEVPEGAKIEDLLLKLKAKGLAEWDERGERIVGDYKDRGVLEEGKTYNLLPALSPEESEEVLEKLKEIELM